MSSVALLVNNRVSASFLIPVVLLIISSGLCGLACSLLGHDILWDVRRIAPGDDEYASLFWKFPFPGKRWTFVRTVLLRHKQLFPSSKRTYWFKVFLVLQILLFLSAVVLMLTRWPP